MKEHTTNEKAAIEQRREMEEVEKQLRMAQNQKEREDWARDLRQKRFRKDHMRVLVAYLGSDQLRLRKATVEALVDKTFNLTKALYDKVESEVQ